MVKEYASEEIWRLYERLPQELKETIFSEETAENIGNICERNGVEEEKISQIARLTGRVLLGLLPPAEFGEALEKELALEPVIARRVSQEIFRFIFFPVKTLLEELYRVEIEPPAKPAIPSGEMPEVERIRPLAEKEERSKKDIYREPIE